MPVLNLIEPVYVSRGLKEGESDNLEQNAGLTLSNIILQLSNLSLRGGQLIESLLEEVTNLNKKFYRIKNKIEIINSKIDHLDPQHISHTPTDSVSKKQQKIPQYEPVFMRYRLPQSLADQYNSCEAPPPFQLLFGHIHSTQRDTNFQDRFKFYSNTDYFKESWREKKQQDKIKKRILKNELLKLQTAEIVDTLEKDEKFYPLPIHRERPRITETRKLVRTPAVIEPWLEEQPKSHSDADTASLYSGYVAPSFGNTTVYYADTVMTSLYSRRGSCSDDTSVIYEVFESADVASLNSSTQLDKISLDDSAKVSSQDRTMDDSIQSSLSQTDSREESSGRRILSLRDCDVVTRRESAVKTLLKSFVQERRRYIQYESTSISDYSDESSSESDSTGSDGED